MIKLSSSSLDTKEYIAVKKILQSNYLGMGPEVKKFEDNLKKFLKRETVCVSSGTAALQLALQALGLKKNSEIIIPSLNFISGYHAIIANNLKPVLCDNNKETLSIDIEDLKKKITKRTKAIIPVYYSGYAYDNLLQIYKIAKIHKLRVVEDAAHAFGSYYNKKLIGSFGDISCFSFDGIKNITSGEGGCVVTNDKKIINKIKDYRFLSIVKESEKRYVKKKGYFYDIKEIGWRYHMSDIMAAIGNVQLKKINLFRKKRLKLLSLYKKKLFNNKKIELLFQDNNIYCPHISVIKSKKKINRKHLKNYFDKKKIEIGYNWKPIHKLTIFKKNNIKKVALQNTNYIAERIFSVPLHYNLKKKDVIKISNLINEYFK
jgi:dTDP-4-amino-4,6-dideoxygalactose transaminase